MRKIAMGLIMLSCGLLACSKKLPPLNYLHPADRDNEGLLDESTLQIISVGYAVDLKLQPEFLKTRVPADYPNLFDTAEIYKFNESLRKKPGKNDPPLPESFTLADIIMTELNQLNPNEIDLGQIDQRFKKQLLVKKKLFDNACLSAQVNGMYRYLVMDTNNRFFPGDKPLPEDSGVYLNLDKNYFPPKKHYSAEINHVLTNLNRIFKEKKYRYEIIQEKITEAEKMDCKMNILIHQSHLAANHEFLRGAEFGPR